MSSVSLTFLTYKFYSGYECILLYTETVLVVSENYIHSFSSCTFGVRYAECNMSHCAAQVYFHTRIDTKTVTAIYTDNHHVYTERSNVVA